MFDNLRNLGSLLKNSDQIRERAEQFKSELEKKTVEGEAGGGAVRVVMTGRGRVVRIDLDQPLMLGLAGDDKTMVEELITAAVNNALDKVQELMAEEMRKATGGLNIPGLDGLLG